MGVTSSRHNTLPIPGHDISFQALSWHGCFHEHHEIHMLQKAVCTMFSCLLRDVQDNLCPVCKCYAKSTNVKHHQTQCLSVLQDSSQGRQSEQDFLWVPVRLKIFNIYFYTKPLQSEHFPVHLQVHRWCPFPHLSLLQGCSHGCIQHKACGRLSPEQSSRDNHIS